MTQSFNGKSGYRGWQTAAGVVLGMLIVPVIALLYFRYGGPPVAVADTPFPFEAQIVHVPLNARTARDMPKTVPFAASEDVLEGGARVYRAQCAMCHGIPGTDAAFASHMFPVAPQLWRKHSNSDVVGVSDDEAGETYWKVANGIRLTGMPSYNHLLSEKEMWQVSFVLKNADQKLPSRVLTILNAKADETP